ncbi:hypothetical protein HOI18_03675 [Candidatus Uhrbacteria bacterium]|jgi:hypothetical protein|nr:hypothetical protein [Candidatus Uhrbacteria bacterium]
MGFASMKDMLAGKGGRAAVNRQLSSAFVVQIANSALQDLLPKRPGRRDAVIASYVKNIMTINVISGAVSQFVKQNEHKILEKVAMKAPEYQVSQFRYRIVSKYKL